MNCSIGYDNDNETLQGIVDLWMTCHIVMNIVLFITMHTNT